mmetsp:Transcript_2514/g.3871  ORF Transcript_2514/g.3871 Transcript_2514/m.3871 type:complete len:679 (+) Transcript_2514:68-2104(+)
MTVNHHKLCISSNGCPSTSDLARELSDAESSLHHVIEALNHDDELSILNEIENQGSAADFTKTPKGEIMKLHSMSKEIGCLSLAKSYINAIKKVSPSNGMVVKTTSMKHLVELESQLRLVLQSHHQDLDMSSKSFKAIYQEISERHEKIQRHIKANAILHIRKTLKQVTYPSQRALQFILSELESSECTESDLKTHMQAIGQIDGRLVSNELVKPIVQRVRHHFLTSGTIPQEKIMKIPHLIIAYLRQVIPYTAPVVSTVQCEVYFYPQINALIQHVLFQRGYFEKIGDASPVVLTNFIQDVLKYDEFIGDSIRAECSEGLSSLTELLICKNTKLFDWWIKAQRNHAIYLLDRKASEVCVAAITSTTESCLSLVCSQRLKVSLLRGVNRSRYLQQIIVPTCMHYLDLQHKRATGLRNGMNTSTMHNLSANINQWLVMIESTRQMARVLTNDHSPGSSSKSLDLQGLHTLSESFEKFSDAMVQECTHRYIDLLMERSALSSFLMTAGHLLSHGSVYHQSGMEDVFMILNVWNGDFISTPNRINIRIEIVSKICTFLQQQLLEVLLDESLEMIKEGCREFWLVVEGIVRAVNGSDEQDFFGRLNGICRFMLDEDKIHGPICNLLDRDDDGKIDIFLLEADGTLYEEVESMIRGKGYVHLTVSEACSILNRVQTLEITSEL